VKIAPLLVLDLGLQLSWKIPRATFPSAFYKQLRIPFSLSGPSSGWYHAAAGKLRMLTGERMRGDGNLAPSAQRPSVAQARRRNDPQLRAF